MGYRSIAGRLAKLLTGSLSLLLLATGAAGASSSVSLVASPFQSPGLQGAVVVAVRVSPADGVTSLDLVYRYDPSRLSPAGVYRTGYTNAFSMTSSTATAGVVEIHLTGPAPLAGSGEVAWVVFQTAAAATDTASLSWVSAALNGGAIPSQTTGTSVDMRSAVTVSVPASVQGAPGSRIQIPISASAFAAGSGFDLALTFNPEVLHAVSVQRTSLTSCMTVVSNLNTPGAVYIALYGVCSISVSGPLVQIAFDVVGPLGARTPLNVTRGGINEGHVDTVLEDGLFLSCVLADGDGDGFNSCAGDCDDASPTVHPGATEACNGLDDDCDGLVDDVAPLVGTPFLSLEKRFDETGLLWSTVPGAAAYDAVRGDLGTLAATGGDFSVATDLCLANDTTTPESADAAVPFAGTGFWYVVRAETCGGFGTYDEDSPAQVGLRDPEIAASASSCR